MSAADALALPSAQGHRTERRLPRGIGPSARAGAGTCHARMCVWPRAGQGGRGSKRAGIQPPARGSVASTQDKAAFGDFQMKARHTHCVPQANCKKRGDELVAGLGCLAMGQRWPDHSRFWPKPPHHLRPLARCGQGLLTAQQQSGGSTSHGAPP